MTQTSLATELAELDAVGQANLVHDGQVAPIELVDAAITRIEALDPAIGAVVTRCFDQARQDALAAPSFSPFCGVPFLLKDMMPPVGVSSGPAPAHVEWRSSDSDFTMRLRYAGMSLCGRTRLGGSHDEAEDRSSRGPVRNPWAPSRLLTASSGGSAAAVASRMVPVATGTDTGGSLRASAGVCGLVGLKPNRGRTTLDPSIGDLGASFSCQFVLTRSVRDAAALLDVVAGPGSGDPYAAAAPQRPYFLEVGAVDSRLRVSVMLERPDGEDHVDVECVAGVELAASLLKDLGHSVVTVDTTPLSERSTIAARYLVRSASVAREVARWADRLGRRLGPEDVGQRTWAFVETGTRLSAADYIAATERIAAYARRVSSIFDTIDVLVTPTLPEVSPRDDEPDSEFRASGAYTVPFNVTGQPAISLPLHWTDDGHPVGVQFVAGPGREDVLIRLASQLEAVVAWQCRRPRLTCSSIENSLQV